MKTFKQFITEMPQSVGALPSVLDDDKMNFVMYNNALSHKQIGTHDDKVITHNKKGKQSKYSVLDNANKRIAFSTTVERRPKSKAVPFPHHTQTYVGKDPQSDLGKGFGSNFAYDHLVHGKDVPLVSDEQQYTGGHKMWHSLINRAHKEGHHAYLVDNGKLTKITPENKDEIMSSSYGKGEEFRKRRYAISKTPLGEE
jgi:hypothetical protein